MTCAFCRTPGPKTDKEDMDRLKRRVEQNDAFALLQLGEKYLHGHDGLKKDLTKAMDLFLEAGKLGCADAYERVGHLYTYGNGVEKDNKKARQYYELGAIGGGISARHNLACFENRAGNIERACKHFMICAKRGFEPSLKEVKIDYEEGNFTKDEYEEALRAYQKYHDDTRSVMRDEALVYRANTCLYFGHSS